GPARGMIRGQCRCRARPNSTREHAAPRSARRPVRVVLVTAVPFFRAFAPDYAAGWDGAQIKGLHLMRMWSQSKNRIPAARDVADSQERPGAAADSGSSPWGVWRYSRRALDLVWTTSRGLTIAFAILTVAAGLLPAGAAYVGKLIVDAVVAAIDVYGAGADPDYAGVLRLVALEGALVAGVAAAQRGIDFCQSLLRLQLAERVNVMILE